MIEHEKSRPRRQPEAGQAETAALAGAAISHSHDTTTPARRQVLPRLAIADILPHERENALKMRDIKAMMHTDSRSIRLMIQRERRRFPIVADCQSGYWVSDDEIEVRQFCRSMRSRARQIMMTARAVEVAAGLTSRSSPQIDGQLSLDGDVEGGGG